VPSIDLLYRSFEDRHRGHPNQISERQGHDYLELLRDLPNPELPVVDLGCGRGELVRLLHGEGLVALGVDSNPGQLTECKGSLFLDRDMFGWLDSQADGSHRAVVSVHVVEHLPLELQIRLVFESRRILAAGGVLLLETPNSLSLSTAATNFWVDPTHERPVDPRFLEFLAIEAGFVEVELRPLHEIELSFRGADEAPQLVGHLNSIIFGSADMSVVARR
jgi:O-antigen chain-terminating methyltransferase